MNDVSSSVVVSLPVADKDQCWSGRGSASQCTRDEEMLVPDLVSEFAAAAPDTLAIAQGKLAVTYRQLDERANQLAWLLTSLGVGPDVVVAIYMNRSPAAIVAALGVLKSGGAYLPIDP